MARGKRNVGTSISSHPRSLGPLPESLQVRMEASANDAPVIGTRVELVKTKGPRAGLRLGSRGTVIEWAPSGFVVDFDDSVRLLVRYKDDHWLEITEQEIAERREIVNKTLLRGPDKSRFSIIPRSREAKAVCRRNWQGEVIEVLPDARVRVRFDRGGEAVLDPLREDWRNITYQEIRDRRLKAVAKKKVAVGTRLRLTADVPDEPRLREGMRGVVRVINSSGMLEMDWDSLIGLNLVPDTDSFRVLGQLSPEEFAAHCSSYREQLAQAARDRAKEAEA